VCKADNLPPSCAVGTKSGSLNFLEPSGFVEACNGTALPFFMYEMIDKFLSAEFLKHIKSELHNSVCKRMSM